MIIIGDPNYSRSIASMCSMRQFTGLMPTNSILNITDPQRRSEDLRGGAIVRDLRVGGG